MTLSMVTLIGVAAAAGQKGVRLDRDFTLAIQAADAGVEQARFRVAAARQPGSRVPATGSVNVALPGGQASYSWYAQRIGTSREWQVFSDGTYRGKTRRVVAVFKEDRLFFASAFADMSVTFNGGNVADSYHSGPGTARRLPGPGRTGLVGSNGNIRFLGNSSTVDGVQLWDHRAGNNTPARCEGQGTVGLAPSLQACSTAATSQPLGDVPYQQRLAERRELTPAPSELQARLAACGNGPYPSLNITGTAGGDTMPAPMTAANGQNNRSAPAAGTNAGYYCYSNVDIRADVTLHSSATRQNPVVLVVNGNVTLHGNGRKVNCSPCASARDSAPDSGALQIYIVGNGQLSTSPSNRFGAAVYGPQATCGGGSQNEIYGSLICSTIANVGGWAFHYDEALESLGNTQFVQTKYQER
jgi:hypothetical protein